MHLVRRERRRPHDARASSWCSSTTAVDDARDARGRSSPSPSGAAHPPRRCRARRAPRSTSCRAGTPARPRCRGRSRAPCHRAGTGHRSRRHQIGPQADLEVAAEHGMAHVVVDLVRAGDPARAARPRAGRRRRARRRGSRGRCSPSGSSGWRSKSSSSKRRAGGARPPAVSAYGFTSRSPGTSASPSSPSRSNAMHFSSSRAAAPRCSATPAMPGRSGVCTFSRGGASTAGRARRGRRVDGATPRHLDVGRVVAVRAPDEVVLADRGDGHELVVDVAADLTRLALDGAKREPAAREDTRVGVVHVVGTCAGGRRRRRGTSTRPSSGTRAPGAVRTAGAARRGTSS